MIVLDEQLQGRGIEDAIARWYPGRVTFIMDSRPDTIIKDEAIPALLRQLSEPTFVTINESDFWHRATASRHFCIVCVALPDARANELTPLLQRLLRHPDFKTKALRMGKVARLTTATAQYYAVSSPVVQMVEKW